jgi:hypothetical protein
VSTEEDLRAQNHSLCAALASWQARAHAAEKRCQDVIKLADEADKLLVGLLLDTGPDRMSLQDRRIMIQATERLRRIQKKE